MLLCSFAGETLDVSSREKGFRAIGEKVRHLTDEAAKWISENPKLASDFMLVSRPKEWAGDLKKPKHYPSKKIANPRP